MKRGYGVVCLALFVVTICARWNTLGAEEVTPTLSGEAIKLEYKLEAGTELCYTAEGALKQKFSTIQGDIEGGAEIQGVSRMVVADVDPESGVMLVGRVTNLTFDVKMTTPQGEQTMTQKQDQARVLRADRTGKAIPRQSKDKSEEDGENPFLRMMLNQLDEKVLDVVPLPSGAIAVGGKWESELDLPLMGLPLRSKAVSTLSEVKDVDGRKCALIRSEFSAAESDEPMAMAMDVSGEGETLFDIARGIALETRTKLVMKMSGSGTEGELQLDTGAALESVRAMPHEDAARHAEMISALDSAISKLYMEEPDKALEELGKLQAAGVEEDWKKGVDHVVTVAKQIQKFGTGAFPGAFIEDEEDLSEDERLLEAAEDAGLAGNWREAAAKYLELEEKHPDSVLVPQALAAAAEIYERRIADKAKAEEIRKRLVSLREKQSAGDTADPMEIYKLAGAYAEAGDLDKAVEAYRSFVAVENEAAPARLKVLAQYRRAGLLEKLGRTAEALTAYRAAEQSPASDDYSKKIKDLAGKKAKKLEDGTTR